MGGGRRVKIAQNKKNFKNKKIKIFSKLTFFKFVFFQ